MNRWIKKGLIFDPSAGRSPWIRHYAALPVADYIDEKTVRIYFSTRDEAGRSIPTFLEADPADPSKIHYIHDRPILELGPLGTFDDNGIMCSWIVSYDEKKFLYYIGWNPQQTVSYRLSIGLACSTDGGITFSKHALGPICDRAIDEPYFNTAPCVIMDNGLWKMWYVSCTGWKIINDWPEPFYNVKYATSSDGIHWQKQNITCINYDDFTEAIGKPCVYIENGLYKMYYSFRNATNYRSDPEMAYRLGYAESHNGIEWTRMDDKAGILLSNSGWDSQMMEYATTYVHNGNRYLIYNGNSFGKSGFGYAIMDISR